MQLGTAKITATPSRHLSRTLFIVEWINVGSFLHNEPRAFFTETDAREFCRERGLFVVRS